jgi:hypothetical protein
MNIRVDVRHEDRFAYVLSRVEVTATMPDTETNANAGLAAALAAASGIVAQISETRVLIASSIKCNWDDGNWVLLFVFESTDEQERKP